MAIRLGVTRDQIAVGAQVGAHGNLQARIIECSRERGNRRRACYLMGRSEFDAAALYPGDSLDFVSQDFGKTDGGLLSHALVISRHHKYTTPLGSRRPERRRGFQRITRSLLHRR